MPKVLALLALGALLAAPAAAAPSIAVAKYSKGNVRAAAKDSAAKPLKPSDLVTSGTRLEAGQDGKAVLRLLPDNAFLEVRPKTVFGLRRIKSKDKRVRRVALETGEVVFGLRKKSEPVQCENVNTTATASRARFSCRADDKAVGVLIVQDGEITVYNRPKDLTVTVRSGQKAVSDLNGVKVTDASDAELESVGFRQNTLEVDFINPQTDEFTTLEVEYETSY